MSEAPQPKPIDAPMISGAAAMTNIGAAAMPFNMKAFLSSEGMEGCVDDDFDVNDFTILIFGGGGDLSRKKLLPTLFHLYQRKFLPQRFSIIAAGSPKDTDRAGFLEIVRKSLQENAAEDYEDAAFGNFAEHIFFQFARFEHDDQFQVVKDLLDKVAPRDEFGRMHVVYYMSVPPLIFGTIATQIDKFGMNRGDYDPKLIIEKPFGTDLLSSVELNASLHAVFKENQIYRIDHYLGKETVQNLLFFRFGNSIFEPLWNNKYIDNVQITVAEDLGIETRGKFYETAGVVRDIIQNHALQLMALVGMEPPVSFDADSIRDEKEKVIRSIEVLEGPAVLQDTVFGQYAAGAIKGKPVVSYKEETFVAPDSRTATYFAGKFSVNNWRWSGVPFYVRAGKRLGQRVTEISIQFKDPPHRLFGSHCQNLSPNVLTFTIQPDEAINLSYCVKYPNTISKVWPVAMHFSYGDAFQEKSLPAYARLILECLKGDLTLFVRQDSIESMWEVADPILAAWTDPKAPAPASYTGGSHGPSAADTLLSRDGRVWLTNLEQRNA